MTHATQTLVVQFDETQTIKACATLLDVDGDEKPVIHSIKAMGGYLNEQATEAAYAWLIGDDYPDPSPTSRWTTVTLADTRVQYAWQLRTGLFISLAELIQSSVAQSELDVRVVLIDPTIANQKAIPGWLRLSLERLGWKGRAMALKKLPMPLSDLWGEDRLAARKSFAQLNDRLRRDSGGFIEQVFGQRRANLGMRFTLRGPGGVDAVHTVVSKGEMFPMQSEHRLVLDDDTAASSRPWELKLLERKGKDPEIRLSPMGEKEVPDCRLLFVAARIESAELWASDPNGGVRIIFEVDRFGRLYFTLRDDFDRLIKIKTILPQSSDGQLWSPHLKEMSPDYKRVEKPDDPFVPADRIFISVPFMQQREEDVVSLWGWERLPGALAATSYNAGPCERYHKDLPSRQRRGATMDRVADEIAKTISLHRDRWAEPGSDGLTERVLAKSSRELQSNKDLVEALVEHLPEEMHHFRALLMQLAREVV